MNRPRTTGKIVVPRDISDRIDRFLVMELSISRSRIQRNIQLGNITVNGEPVKSNRIIEPGNIIEYNIPESPSPSLAPEAIGLSVLFEDDFLIVVEKPAGMVVHPAPGSPDGTLVNALLHRFHDLSFPPEDTRPGIVHRLDKDTSGLIIVAKNEDIKAKISKSIMAREVNRSYRALTWGHLKKQEGNIEAAIGRHPTDRKKMSTFGTSLRSAQTMYRVIERYDVCELLDVILMTGRTHQIRVHFASIGHPVVGDTLYQGGRGREKGFSGQQREKIRSILSRIDRQALHAYKLEFLHPVDQRPMSFVSDLPEDLRNLLTFLREEAGETSVKEER